MSEGVTPATLTVEVDGQWRTPETSELTWTNTAPGGSYSAESVVTERPLLDALAPDARVVISDPHDATVLWDGRLRDPSGKDDNGRRTGEISLQGSVMDLYDRKWVLPYVVNGPEGWVSEDSDFEVLAGTRMVIGEATQVSETDGNNVDGPALRLQMRQNSTWAQFRKARGRCTAFDGADLTVAGVRFDVTGAFGVGTAPDWRVRAVVGQPGFHYEPIDIPAPSELGWAPGNAAFAGDPDFPHGQTLLRVELSCEVAGSGPVNSDNFRVDLSGLFAIGNRVKVDGTAASPDWVHQARVTDIVADILGRSGIIDPDRVTLVDGGYRIDNLNYQSPVSAGDVLMEMLAFETGFQWMLHPSHTTLHGFSYQAWPTSARYVISQADGVYKETIAEHEIYNRVPVRFRDRYGRWAVINDEIADPDIYPATRRLTEQGRIRDMPETLELLAAGSWTNARTVSRSLLRDVAQPRISATFGTARPVLDLSTGVYVHPWQVKPGYMAMVQETGNAYRITQTVCDGHAGTVNLTMGNPAKSADQLVAQINRRRRA